MAIKLNKAGYERAVEIIKNGLEVEHNADMNAWDAIKATANEEERYLDTHDLDEYGQWFLGVDTDADPKDRSKYLYPFGDFSVLHKSALLVAQQQAAQKNQTEIASAAQKLLGMIKGGDKQ